jgi:flagellar hook-basal body complex protein FliE
MEEIMNIASVSNIAGLNNYDTNSALTKAENRNASFESIFDAAKNMVNETTSYEDAAKKAEMAFSLGLSDNTHDLQVAQQKANLSLQYTIAVRNKVLDAYKEIMNLQF